MIWSRDPMVVDGVDDPIQSALRNLHALTSAGGPIDWSSLIASVPPDRRAKAVRILLTRYLFEQIKAGQSIDGAMLVGQFPGFEAVVTDVIEAVDPASVPSVSDGHARSATQNQPDIVDAAPSVTIASDRTVPPGPSAAAGPGVGGRPPVRPGAVAAPATPSPEPLDQATTPAAKPSDDATEVGPVARPGASNADSRGSVNKSGATPLRTVGPYRLLRVLGQGGMGTVYEAIQPGANRHVALKLINPSLVQSLAAVARFRAEAEAAAKIEHENAVTVYDVGSIGDDHYFTMKLVRGESLQDRLNRLKVSNQVCEPREASRWIEQAARAVDAGHHRGVLHRDLKPGNILLEQETGRALVTDFGLAKLQSDDHQMTRTGEVFGTPSYMPPEQAIDAGRVGPEADVYSLGATLYHALAGVPPFKGVTVADTLRQVLDQDARSLTTVVPRFDRDLATIVHKCLEKAPSARYPTAAALADDLARWRDGEPIEARPLSLSARVVKRIRRRPAQSAVIGLIPLLLMVGAAAALATWQASTASRQTHLQSALREAESELERLLRVATVSEADLERANQLVAQIEQLVPAAGESAAARRDEGFQRIVQQAIRRPRVSEEELDVLARFVATWNPPSAIGDRLSQEIEAGRRVERPVLAITADTPPPATAEGPMWAVEADVLRFRDPSTIRPSAAVSPLAIEFAAERDALDSEADVGDRTPASVQTMIEQFARSRVYPLPSAGWHPSTRIEATFDKTWTEAAYLGLVLDLPIVARLFRKAPPAGASGATLPQQYTKVAIRRLFPSNQRTSSVTPTVEDGADPTGLPLGRDPSLPDVGATRFQVEMIRHGAILVRAEYAVRDVADPTTGALRIEMTRRGRHLSLQLGQQEPLLFEDFVHPPPRPGVAGLIAPPGVGLVAATVFATQEPVVRGPLDEADSLLGEGQYEQAWRTLGQVAASETDAEIVQEARFKQGVALESLGRLDDAKAVYYQLVEPITTRWGRLAAVRLMLRAVEDDDKPQFGAAYVLLASLGPNQNLSRFVPWSDRDQVINFGMGDLVGWRNTRNLTAVIDRTITLAELIDPSERRLTELKVKRLEILTLEQRHVETLEAGLPMLASMAPDHPERVALLFAICLALKAVDKTDQAVELIDADLPPRSMDDDRWNLYIIRACLEAHRGNWRQAEADVDRLVEGDQRLRVSLWPRVYLMRGLARFRRGDVKGAEADFRQGWSQAVEDGMQNDLHSSIAGSLAGNQSDADLDRMIRQVLAENHGDASLNFVRTGTLPTERIYGTLRNLWRSDRGRRLAEDVAYDLIPHRETLSAQVLLSVYEAEKRLVTGDWTGPAEVDPVVDEAIWNACVIGYRQYREGKVNTIALVGIAQAAQGVVNALGWGIVVRSFDPAVVVPTGYGVALDLDRAGRRADALVVLGDVAARLDAVPTMRSHVEALAESWGTSVADLTRSKTPGPAGIPDPFADP